MKAILAGALETGLGTVLSNVTVFVENGKIADIAEGLDPRNADEVIDASDMIVTPGLIDAHTHMGTYCEGFPESMADANDMVNPVAPHLRILDAIYQDDTAFADALSGGVTCVQTLPGSGNVIGGQGAIIKTSTASGGRKKTVDEMVVKAPSSMKAALGENPIRVYKEKQKLPNTRMGNAALLRQAFVEAENYRNKMIQARTKNEPAERNLQHEALLPVLDGDLSLCVHAHRCDDIATAVRIAGEFSIPFTVEHCTEGHLIAPFLAEKNVFAAVGPTLTGKPKIELRNKTWDTPLALWKAGVHFCIITDHPVVPIEHLSVCLSLAVRAGLPREEALKAVTIYAAEHLGIADRVGSVERGKDADLVIWDGDPLDARSRAVATIIDGETVYSRS
ncbi:imidazolonepropionase-like amidohydrolase [Aminivibrio pyruvatiphilus]|uniref:Imidazolonepropionase-like amidohydrolase n=1 Tax=Aminivibrio pyruvatiphilus TaxID=1005740 RepID=A0A4R8MAZ9_9BACT|nr:amidohydrolase [Aminivibrio pyruvatiphilus]TDY62810.1 imidazolonepropionase-like amidohydrolase [Aminivibrio pyruvatiphilus]